ncbi:acyltransferase [Gemmobacter serpentinus]|uniref:acyltransferase n=1 Tax=Gemmobacter serpentinus TaxID=2652247 RepID=UPI00124E9269|nr:transferase hexapeptide repeat family protein [Gemmobacter serpentinus]
MARVYAYDGVVPVIDPGAYVHPDAVVIGDVIIAAGVYIGPCAVLRGDFGRIVLHHGCNVQETCVIHSFPGKDVVIEEAGHIGHGAVLHGCHIGRNAMVGMNAVVMDEASIGENSIIAAMAFVKAGMQVPPNVLAVGAPAKVTRDLSAEEIEWKRQGTGVYQRLAIEGGAKITPAMPLAEIEAGRRRTEAPAYDPLLLAKMKMTGV